MLYKLNHSLQTIEAWLAAGSILLLLSLSLFQILLRNFFDYGYPEIDIINRHLLVMCGMMGAVIATSRRAHIKTDAICALLSPPSIAWLQFPLALFAAFICALMCYYSVIFVLDEWQYAPVNERWTLPFTLIYPSGFALMSLHFLLNAFLKDDGEIIGLEDGK